MFLTHSKDQGTSDDYRHPKFISSSFPDFAVEGRRGKYNINKQKIVCQTHSPLGDNHPLPSLGGAFAALFQARNLALHTACNPHRHCQADTEHDSAGTEQNKGFQSLLSSYLGSP